MKVTFITYGERKADGHPDSTFKEALTRFQADIDTMGRCSLPRWRATAACRQNKSVRKRAFMGEAGVSAGLADAVMSPDAAFRSLIESIS